MAESCENLPECGCSGMCAAEAQDVSLTCQHCGYMHNSEHTLLIKSGGDIRVCDDVHACMWRLKAVCSELRQELSRADRKVEHSAYWAESARKEAADAETELVERIAAHNDEGCDAEIDSLREENVKLRAWASRVLKPSIATQDLQQTYDELELS